MSLRTTERIEAAIDGTAAMVFAGAAGFAALRVLESPPPALAGGSVAFLCAFLLLRTVRPIAPELAIAGFDLPPVRVSQMAELVLSDSDRFRPASADELLLDDVLSDPEPDSRVVRLFDPAAMPADLPDARRDPRFAGASAVPTPPDASQALHEALAKLRHSLR